MLLVQALHRAGTYIGVHVRYTNDFRDLIARWSIILQHSSICRSALEAGMHLGPLSSSLIETIAKEVNQQALQDSNDIVTWKQWYVDRNILPSLTDSLKVKHDLAL
jgi:hypothetical protein